MTDAPAPVSTKRSIFAMMRLAYDRFARRSAPAPKAQLEDDDDFFDDCGRCDNCAIVDEAALFEAETRFKRRDIPDALIWLERALGFEFYDLADQVRRFYEK